MDMMMPGSRDHSHPHDQDAPELVGIPVVLISPFRKRKHASGCRFGAVDFIAKPFYREGSWRWFVAICRRRVPWRQKPRDDTRVLVVDDDPR